MQKEMVELTSQGLRRVLVLAEELERSNLSKLSFGERAQSRGACSVVEAVGIAQFRAGRR
jgi:hypothetical protein